MVALRILLLLLAGVAVLQAEERGASTEPSVSDKEPEPLIDRLRKLVDPFVKPLTDAIRHTHDEKQRTEGEPAKRMIRARRSGSHESEDEPEDEDTTSETEEPEAKGEDDDNTSETTTKTSGKSNAEDTEDVVFIAIVNGLMILTCIGVIVGLIVCLRRRTNKANAAQPAAGSAPPSSSAADSASSTPEGKSPAPAKGKGKTPALAPNEKGPVPAPEKKKPLPGPKGKKGKGPVPAAPA